MTNTTNIIIRRNYPTPERIMTNPVKHKKEVLTMAKTWRKETWATKKRGTPSERFEAIAIILTNIATIYNKPVRIKLEVDSAIGPRYDVPNNTIIIDQKLSIITAFHELAHHLFGINETQACRWSIWLFKKVWPIAFDRLTWEGHLRIKQNTCQNSSPAAQTATQQLAE